MTKMNFCFSPQACYLLELEGLIASLLWLSPSSAEQDMIFRLLSGILSLGNITFNEKEVILN